MRRAGRAPQGRADPAGKPASAAPGKASSGSAPEPASPVIAKVDAWSPRALAGPVASIEEWCKRQPKSEPCLSLDEASRARHAGQAGGAARGRWLVTGNAEEEAAQLALQTAAGWFVSLPAGEPGLFVRPVEVVAGAGAPSS